MIDEFNRRVWSIVINFTSTEESAIRLQDQLHGVALSEGYDDSVCVLRPGRREEAYSDRDKGKV